MIYTPWGQAIPVSVQNLVELDLRMVEDSGNYCSVNATLIKYELQVLLLSVWYLICGWFFFWKRIAQGKSV